MFARYSIGRFLPYAQWAFYMVSLGHAGYNLYVLWQKYREQYEEDARNGIVRTLDETIELVIRPRRRAPPEVDDSSNRTERVVENQENEVNTVAPNSPIITYPPSEVTAEEGTAEDYGTPGPSGHTSGPTHSGHQSLNAQTSDDPPLREHQDPSETNSNASTTLESTDSNRGILKDIYSECFICTRSLNDPKKAVATLPFCMHPFHQSCLDSVIRWHPQCPVCDYHIFSPI